MVMIKIEFSKNLPQNQLVRLAKNWSQKPQDLIIQNFSRIKRF
jgi:hypothetical protein